MLAGILLYLHFWKIYDYEIIQMQETKQRERIQLKKAFEQNEGEERALD